MEAWGAVPSVNGPPVPPEFRFVLNSVATVPKENPSKDGSMDAISMAPQHREQIQIFIAPVISISYINITTFGFGTRLDQKSER